MIKSVVYLALFVGQLHAASIFLGGNMKVHNATLEIPGIVIDSDGPTALISEDGKLTFTGTPSDNAKVNIANDAVIESRAAVRPFAQQRSGYHGYPSFRNPVRPVPTTYQDSFNQFLYSPRVSNDEYFGYPVPAAPYGFDYRRFY